MAPETPLQREVREYAKVHLARLTKALEDCKTQAEEDQCVKAYAELWWCEVDCISQRHGMKPMAFKMELRNAPQNRP
jgi:hypothetical protein